MSWRTCRWPYVQGSWQGARQAAWTRPRSRGWAGIVAMNDLAAALSAFARNAAE